MYYLAFSQKASDHHGCNAIRNDAGKVVEYTNASENPNWKEDYRWEDAVEVGTVEKMDAIIHYGISMYHIPPNRKHRQIEFRSVRHQEGVILHSPPEKKASWQEVQRKFSKKPWNFLK